MVVRKITLNKKEYFMDEFFNIYGDKDKKEHKGVMLVRGEPGKEHFLASPGKRRTQASLNDEAEYDEFWAARKLFNKKMAAKAEEKKAAAPKPKPKINIAHTAEINYDEMEALDDRSRDEKGNFLTPGEMARRKEFGIPSDSGMFGKKVLVVWDARTQTSRAPTETELLWMADNPGLGLEYMTRDEDFPEE